MNKPSVFISIFTLDERDGWFAPGILEFAAALSVAAKTRRICLKVSSNVKPIDYARNCIVAEFLASGFDWLLMIDNDMKPPPNLLDMLDRAEKHMRILVPRFFVFCQDSFVKQGSVNPRIPLTLMWQFLKAPVRQEWNELAAAGTGVMFVHREVFQRLGSRPTWFRFSQDESGKIIQGEDLNFCANARTVGFPVWGNENFEVDHFKTVSLSALAQSLQYAIAVLPPPLRHFADEDGTVAVPPQAEIR